MRRQKIYLYHTYTQKTATLVLQLCKIIRICKFVKCVDNNVGSINSESLDVNDEEIVLEAIQKTGATSIIDIVKIVEYIKEQTGKDIDQALR